MIRIAFFSDEYGYLTQGNHSVNRFSTLDDLINQKAITDKVTSRLMPIAPQYKTIVADYSHGSKCYEAGTVVAWFGKIGHDNLVSVDGGPKFKLPENYLKVHKYGKNINLPCDATVIRARNPSPFYGTHHRIVKVCSHAFSYYSAKVDDQLQITEILPNGICIGTMHIPKNPPIKIPINYIEFQSQE
ncbi:hypothetical protein Ciccas_009345 [Cichlidogyrus casuarinus]|uniref:Uncharacterized protein n=1 Tax=Cichlidogyrus casuarinus TaxID=1844966 RepID=A0ABD2PXR5_9PLAT